MHRGLCISAVLLCFCFFEVKAQDSPAAVLDGQDMRIDSLSALPSFNPSVMLMSAYPQFPQMQNPSALSIPLFETKEQCAARIDYQTHNAVMASVALDLYRNRLPRPQKPVKLILRVAKMFLSNPYAFPEGCVPLMNPSFPFMFAKTPGMAPYENPYTSDLFPKCIESEYDFTTGTYKQVMVDWSEVQNRLSAEHF